MVISLLLMSLLWFQSYICSILHGYKMVNRGFSLKYHQKNTVCLIEPSFQTSLHGINSLPRVRGEVTWVGLGGRAFASLFCFVKEKIQLQHIYNWHIYNWLLLEVVGHSNTRSSLRSPVEEFGAVDRAEGNGNRIQSRLVFNAVFLQGFSQGKKVLIPCPT